MLSTSMFRKIHEIKNTSKFRKCPSIFRDIFEPTPVIYRNKTTYPYINFGNTMDTLAFPKLPLLNLTYPLMSESITTPIPTEVTEDDTKYIIKLHVTGIYEDDVVVELEDNNLLIKIQTAELSYRRLITLDGDTMDIDNIEAHYEMNNIVIDIPKITTIPTKKRRVILGKSLDNPDVTDDLY